MAIKDKNGNVYQLRGPNPLMQEQTDWDQDQMTLINMSWNSQVVKDNDNPVLAAKRWVRDIGKELNLTPETRTIPSDEFLSELSEPAVAIVEPPVQREPVVLHVDDRLARIIKERGVKYHCAPVIDMKEHSDDFYGTNYRTPVYGETFLFDAVVYDQSDLQIQFWCVRSIPKGSIVYQSSKEGEWERRWWRVEGYSEMTGGYLVSANVSDTNPDFS